MFQSKPDHDYLMVAPITRPPFPYEQTVEASRASTLCRASDTAALRKALKTTFLKEFLSLQKTSFRDLRERRFLLELLVVITNVNAILR